MKYHALTISGKICTGKSALFKLLEQKLGWEVYSASRFFREWCRDHNMPIFAAELRPVELTREIDQGMREMLLQKEKIILEGWLAGYMAQGIPQVLKILLVCKDEERIKRFAKREGILFEKAKEEIQKREDNLFQKWKRVYGRADFFEPQYYDLVVDTADLKLKEVVDLVLARISSNK